MPKMFPAMKLSHDEEVYLRHWMYDELHYQDGVGLAKELQRRHRAVPADLAVLIAAAMPDAAAQEAAGLGPPPIESPTWPWSEEQLRARLAEATALLGTRHKQQSALAALQTSQK